MLNGEAASGNSALITQHSPLQTWPCGEIGRHGRLKICSGLPGWGFKSLQGHLILKDFLAASGFTAA
jgi:hypothetical protein